MEMGRRISDNGRISRLMADLLMQQLGEQRLYWGDGNLTDITELRKKYIDALHAADAGDYTGLIKFVTKGEARSRRA